MAHRSLTAIDGLLATIAFAATAVCVAAALYAGPHFTSMFRDFGSEALLPALTRAVLSPFYAIAIATLSVGACSAGAFLRHRERPGGRALLAIAAVVPIVALGVFFVGAYLPIFELADNVR